MLELFPVAAGCSVGLILGLPKTRLRPIKLALASAVLGPIATYLAGELVISRWFVLLDVAQVALAGSVTLLLCALCRRTRRFVSEVNSSMQHQSTRTSVTVMESHFG